MNVLMDIIIIMIINNVNKIVYNNVIYNKIVIYVQYVNRIIIYQIIEMSVYLIIQYNKYNKQMIV